MEDKVIHRIYSLESSGYPDIIRYIGYTIIRLRDIIY